MLFRYSRWDGSQQLADLDADDLLAAMSDDLMSDGDLWNALRRMFQRGLQNPQGPQVPGLQNLLDRLRKRRQEQLDRYDLGVAVQTEQGLVVPVVRDCDSRSVDELAEDVSRLAEAARAGKLKPEELRGSTFTVTSAGKLGGLLTTPIVNHPEVGILSIGRIAERPVVREGEIVARPTGTVAVTFDHRVVDGARAAEFGLAVIARIERGVELGSP